MSQNQALSSIKLSHPTYEILPSSEGADASGWGFLGPDTEKLQKIYFKFPPLQEDEVRIKITYTSLCHTEIHLIKGDWVPRFKPISAWPMIPGHEIVGDVTHIGSNVSNFKLGEKVCMGPFRNCCESCRNCKKGNDHLCNGAVDQAWTYGDLYWGGYATGIQSKAKFFFKAPKNYPEPLIPSLMCAGVTSFSPVRKYCSKGDKVVVCGAGGIGHTAIMYAKAWGCEVTVLTTTIAKEGFIKKLGADYVIESTEENLKNAAGKYDVILNTIPVMNKDIFSRYFDLLTPSGTYVQLGLPNTKETVPFYVGDLVLKEIVMVGSLVGARKITQETLDFSAEHNVRPIVEIFDFDEFPKAWDKLIRGKPIFRCVIKCDNSKNE